MKTLGKTMLATVTLVAISSVGHAALPDRGMEIENGMAVREASSVSI
jgi:hypothetical protein